MATAVHKTTFEHFHSIHTPDYPTATYLIDPAGLAALEAAGIASKYWKLIAGDTDVGEMTAQEKFDVDAAAPATVDEAKMVTVTADPQVTAVDAVKGSIIVWGHKLYCKLDDGLTTNFDLMGHMDKQDGTSGCMSSGRQDSHSSSSRRATADSDRPTFCTRADTVNPLGVTRNTWL